MKPNVSAIRFQPDGSVYLDIGWTAAQSKEFAHTALLHGPDGRVWRITATEDQPPAQEDPPGEVLLGPEPA
jgi:hypothetical protein